MSKKGGRRANSPWSNQRHCYGRRSAAVFEELKKHPPGTPVETDHIMPHPEWLRDKKT